MSRRFLAASIATVLATASAALAQSPQYLDLNGGSSFNSGFGSGSGVLNWADPLWTTSNLGTGVLSAWTANSTATFSAGGTYTMSLGTGAFTVGGFAFTNAEVTIGDGTSGTLALPAISLVQADVSTGRTGTINAVISGGSGTTFRKSGAGLLILGGANTFAGPVLIDVGTLQLGANGVLPDTATVSIAAGATLDVEGRTETISGLAGAGTVQMGGTSQLSIAVASGPTQTFAGSFTSSGTIVKSGAGTLALTGVSTFVGVLNVNAGTLQLGASDRLSNSTEMIVASGATFDLAGFNAQIRALIGAGAVTLGGGNLIANYGAGSLTWSGSLTGSGSFTKAGPGTLTLSGSTGSTNTAGGFVISGGTVICSGNSLFGSTVPITVAGGATFNLNNTEQTVGSLSGAGTVAIGAGGLGLRLPAGTASFSGSVTGTSADLYLDGPGTQMLSGDVNVSFIDLGTILGSGRLLLGADNKIADTCRVSIAAGATFDLGGHSDTIGGLSGAGTVALGAGTLTTVVSTGLTFSGAITGSGSLVKGGAASLALSGTNTFTGGLSVNEGTVSLLSANALDATADVDIGATGRLSFVNFSRTLRGIAGAGEISLGALTLTLAPLAGSTLEYSGRLTGISGGLTLNGDASLTLLGDSTFTGPLVVTAGSVLVGNPAIAGSTGSLTAGSATLALGTSLVFRRTADITFGGSIGGAGTLIQEGIGKLTVSGVVTSRVAARAGTLVLTAPSPAIPSLVIDGGELRLAPASDLSYGAISGSSGALTKAGAGTLTLTGASSFPGVVRVAGGTLALAGGANRLNPSTRLLGAGGTLALAANAAQTANTLANDPALPIGDSAGGITITSPATFTIDTRFTRADDGADENGRYLYSGVLSGSGTIVKDGTITTTLVLTGTNTHTGLFDLKKGTLQIGDGGTSGTITSPVALAVDTTLVFNRTDASSFGGALSGAGALVKNGVGTLTLTGSATHTGGTTVSAGQLVVAGTLSGSTTVRNDATIGGSGTLSTLAVETGGTLAPGNSPGTLHTGSVTLASGAIFSLELNGAGAGQYDQLDVTGGVTLGDATLSLALGGPLTIGDKLFAILNDGTDAISGTFVGLAQGAEFTASGQGFQIYYAANSATGALTGGNDVALLAVPEPGSAPLLLGGLGIFFARRRKIGSV